MRARCPASSANLGPGFDVLAIALDLYVEVSIEPSESFALSSTGEGSDLPRDEDHLAARVARSVLGQKPVAISIHSDIPVSRGLGSSAALAAATAAACGSTEPFGVAARFDGHAENAAASVFGGLVAASTVGGAAVAEPLPLDPNLGFVLLVPDLLLSTEQARAVLPSQVPFADAVANLGRLGLLIAGLIDASRLHTFAGEDRLHQDARGSLFPEAAPLLGSLRDAGALMSSWSGAGPSLVAICSNEASAQRVRDAGVRAMHEHGVRGRALILNADTAGLVTA